MIHTVKSIICLLSIILLITTACQRSEKETSGIKGNVSKSHFKLEIAPSDATVYTTIYIKNIPEDVKTDQIQWFINDIPVDVHETRLDGTWFNKSDRVQAKIITEHGEFSSNIITIKNSPPKIVKAQILPLKAKRNDRLEAIVQTEDLDDDQVVLSYKWFVNDNLVSNDNYLDTETNRGDKIKLIIVPYDGEDYGEKVILKKVILNSAPKIVANNKPLFDGTVYKYKVNAYDPDGDALSFILRKKTDGMIINSKTGLIEWVVPENFSGTVPVQVEVDDGNGGRTLYSFEVTITRK